MCISYVICIGYVNCVGYIICIVYVTSIDYIICVVYITSIGYIICVVLVGELGRCDRGEKSNFNDRFMTIAIITLSKTWLSAL